MTTGVSIDGKMFRINGRPTYEGRTHMGNRVEGLLMNSRMVQGVFDDENPETRPDWRYPDTGAWDPERNTREFVETMASWRDHGLLAFTVNLQGGSPRGYSREQPWHNSAFRPDGSMKPDFLARMEKILDEADRLGMVVIVGYFYFGQDWRLEDDAAVRRAARDATEWLLDTGHGNILVEINNECDIRYNREILKAPNVHALINEVKSMTREGRRFNVSASFSGQMVPTDNVIAASDFILVHGNGPENPERVEEMVGEIRRSSRYRGQPILFNEDDHFSFDQPRNHFMSALASYASWGYFDPGANNYRDGYQCPPVNWSINTERKRCFFEKLREITGV
ncbi:hypothetical protein AC482_00720 [miscellaneous Crenarchaeota group-15 archaeon DG-45]|uniref:Glycoside hydrolase family 5 domain-containing protein n=1 Tax=miscellaneous Crenarchaeota group-15 archaeon DG-45 TaxID=1685127 RepID=A0A0M0BSS6_9ARCH|nr:MAG: hypothetical protein AC482_00720 [miscellaneous Crenarchaeota group-15 archaeon DG-45]